MVGVGETVMTRDLDSNRKLAIFMDWESDEGLIREGEDVDGTLPGAGVTAYQIGIREGDEPDFVRTLREFHYRGGGDLSPKMAPHEVFEAFNAFYEELAAPTPTEEAPSDIPNLAGITIEYVGTARTKGDVEGALAGVRSHAKAFWGVDLVEFTAERAIVVRKKHEVLDMLRGPIRKGARRELGRRLVEPDIGGPYRDSGLIGVTVRVHPDVEEFDVAFMDRGDCWMLCGSLRIGFGAFEARERVVQILDMLVRDGVELQAKEVWFDPMMGKRLEWVVGENEYHADAAARGENPYYPGLPAVPPGGYRYPNPTGVWKTEARAWFDTYPSQHSSIAREDIEALYAAGALGVNVTNDRSRVGCEVIPPPDYETRMKLIALIRTRFDPEYWGGEVEHEDGESPEESEAKEKAARVRYDEELARETYRSQWTVL